MDDTITDAVARIRMIDGHEHLVTQEMRKEWGTGFFGLLHYVESDLITAGMERGALFARERSLEDKAKLFLKYWKRVGNTSYAWVLRTAMHDLYGMEDWTVDGILELDRKVTEKSRDDQWYSEVLQKHSGIDLALTLIQTLKVDFALFRPIMFLDFAFNLRTSGDLSAVQAESGLSVHSLEDYLAAVDALLEGYAENGMVATKLGHAYWRTLGCSKPTRAAADACFNRLLRTQDKDAPLSHASLKVFQDYLIHHIIQRSTACDLPIQIHTGHHETSVSGDGNLISNSRVGDLVPLFLEYPEANFVLLHGGFPYHHEYLSIAKNFPNVYADLTWLYAISPTASRQLLHQLIEMVPQNKILGFGGDYNFVEGTYAHQKLARTILSGVLTEKVDRGELTTPDAIELAQNILRNNLVDLYRLEC